MKKTGFWLIFGGASADIIGYVVSVKSGSNIELGLIAVIICVLGLISILTGVIMCEIGR